MWLPTKPIARHFIVLVCMILVLDDGYPQEPQCTSPPAADTFDVLYTTFIPQDHVSGPAACETGGPAEIYQGDLLNQPSLYGGYQGGRVQQPITVYTSTSSYSASPVEVGETFQYAYPSPVVGGYLSSADRDTNLNDCYLLNDAALATPTSTYDQSAPSANQVTMNLAGSAHDPLEPSAGTSGITWQFNVTVNNNPSNGLGAVTVNGDVTCYPSHKVAVNNTIIASYNGVQNPSAATIGLCLVSGYTDTFQGIGNVQAY